MMTQRWWQIGWGVVIALVIIWGVQYVALQTWLQQLEDYRYEAPPVKMSPELASGNPLLLADITLPPVPNIHAAPKPSTPVSQLSTPKQSVPPNTVVKSAEPKPIPQVDKPTSITLPHKESAVAKASPEQQAENVFQQLQSAQGIDLQIAWPQAKGQRNAIINYLYRCAGMQFATLENQQLTYLSPQRYVNVSHWIRIAQGALSEQEARWYRGANGVPVRVFPQSIDWQLAQNIAAQLSGEHLQSFRARYQLQRSQLVLSDISVNQHPVGGSWVLHQGQC